MTNVTQDCKQITTKILFMHTKHCTSSLSNFFSRPVESNLHGQGSSIVDLLTLCVQLDILLFWQIDNCTVSVFRSHFHCCDPTIPSLLSFFLTLFLANRKLDEQSSHLLQYQHPPKQNLGNTLKENGRSWIVSKIGHAWYGKKRNNQGSGLFKKNQVLTFTGEGVIKRWLLNSASYFFLTAKLRQK